MEDSLVLLDKRDHLAVITLNRAERLNCFDYRMLVQLEQAVSDIRMDNDIYAVIITGAGDKAFSAGADFKERQTLTEQEVRRNVMKIRDVFSMIEELPQPTIAAMNGYALGGGLELALSCDFRYAVQGALIGLTEVSWAIVPGGGGTQRLPRLIGMAKAKELIFTARRITAPEALELGLLNGVAGEGEDVMRPALDLADEMMKNGPLALRQAKYAIQYGSEADLKTGLRIETQAYEAIIPTSDRLEALAAFKEKRPPQFKGK
ncbi:MULTISPECIES: enoyl-CoA hydratase-related protein [unclassified Paenibacillus]|uniref:enoyl-CoA hydratase-related protein n=1 Tax=unclassified Paenibacillus TaxID=185978 RepID=UPI001AE15F27|nr:MULTISPECIES: enoyl-CoA hydratase-related protein [unclassified Paenibacillus]